MEITQTQQIIYNCYLKALAQASGRGYKPRQNFTKLDENFSITLDRLERFFESHKEIGYLDFFTAGFNFTHEKFLPLDFFCTYRAKVAFKRTR